MRAGGLESETEWLRPESVAGPPPPSTFFGPEDDPEVEEDPPEVASDALVVYQPAGAWSPWRGLLRAQRHASLAALSVRFREGIDLGTHGSSWVVKDRKDLAGLPKSLVDEAARSYQHSAKDGPWRLSLQSERADRVSWYTPLRHLRSAKARKDLYLRFASRCSSGGSADNRRVVVRMLNLRRSLAKLEGIDSYAEAVVGAQETFGSVIAVQTMLGDLARAVRLRAERDVEKIREFAKLSDHRGALEPWDVEFWEERYMEAHFGVQEEMLREYLALPNVLDALGELCYRLFGVKLVLVRSADREYISEDWFHYMFIDPATGAALGHLVIDPYGKDGDRESTWMAPPSDEGSGAVEQIITLRLPRPEDGGPALMRLKNVQSLFHEFGYAVEAIFTTRFHADASEQDSIELVPMFMELWMYDPSTFDRYAVHYETNTRLPRAKLKRLVARWKFGAARSLLGDIARATLDMSLHGQREKAWTWADVRQEEVQVSRDVLGRTPHEEECWTCLFDHIFEGDLYAANEYAFVWGRLLAFDCFSAFQEAAGGQAPGEDAVAALGRRFRETILGEDTSKSFLEVYRDFRGRDPSAEALLAHTATFVAPPRPPPSEAQPCRARRKRRRRLFWGLFGGPRGT